MQFAPLALIFLLIIVVFVLLVWLIPVRLWIAAWSSGARVGFGELIGPDPAAEWSRDNAGQ